MTATEETLLLEKVKEQATGVLDQFKANTISKEEFDKMFADLEEGMTKAQKEAFDELTDTVKLQAQLLDQLKNMRDGKVTPKPSFGEKFAEAIEENLEAIKLTSKSHPHKFRLKVVGDMYLPNNLTGNAQHTYASEAAIKPDRKAHLRDIIPTVNSATGIYTFYRETGGEGAIARQTDPNATKAQIDYDFTEVTVTATYLAGFVVIHKSMLQDLPFLQSGLPEMLRRDFFKAEDADFWAVLSGLAVVGVSGSIIPIEQIIDYVAQVMANDYDPNGILINPASWATMLKTSASGSGYGIPFGTTIDPNGQMRIVGIPVYVSTLVPADAVLVGDFTQAQIIVVDGLDVEFFEQDVDNVRKNKVTVRVEAREALAVLRPDAFVLGVLGDGIPFAERRRTEAKQQEKKAA